MALRSIYTDSDTLNRTTSNEKRKGSNIASHAPPLKKKRKKEKSKTVKPPTAEEMNRLRETENVFHSNLFRMQIDEMLKEVKIKESTYNKLISWFEKLKHLLLNVEFSLNAKLSNKIRIPNIVLPMRNKPKCTATVFDFMKPKSVEIFGSFCTQCILKHTPDIDIVVEMRKEMFLKEDYLNEKYLRKRNYYLSCLASKLSEWTETDANIKFAITSNFDKPLLLIKPASDKLKRYNFYVHLIPENETFKETRFLPIYNNVRYGWFFQTTGDGKLNYPTPYYNAIICQDLVTLRNEKIRTEIFTNNSNSKDALLLLKVWLRQRKFNEGLGSFSGYLMAMFIVYLYKKRKLNRFMSSYQIIRNVWVALEQTNWHIDGISLANVDADSKSIQIYQSAYEVVFVDVTGNANLASNLSLMTYLQIKEESRLAVECLDNQKANLFPALFMTPTPILYRSDHLLIFNKSSIFKKVIKANTDVRTQLDSRHSTPLQFARIIVDMLKKSLNERIAQISYIVEPSTLEWSVNEKRPRYHNVIIGLKMNTEHAYNIIDKGPTANLPEAAEFRKFWGDKSELRRFKDGNVCETVCWANSKDSMQKKRLIIREIVEYVLQNKYRISNDHFVYVADQLESMLYGNLTKIFELRGTGEEVSLSVITAFGNLSKELRALKDLPLEVVSTQGLSAIFRYSDPFPTLPNLHSSIKRGITGSASENAVVFNLDATSKHMPLYVSTVEAVIQFSTTSKWPTDLDAIRRLQAAFYIKLSSVLREKYGYVCQPYVTHVDILKDGYVFRLKIYCNSEITAVKRHLTDDGVLQYNHNAESLYLEKTLLQLPALTSAMHGLHQQFSAFGAACSISKRWLRSQLIDEYYFSDVCVDLLVSYLFLRPEPYTPAHQPQTVFIRFLKLLSSNQWFLEPIIVNFNNDLSREDILQIDRDFDKNRSNLPPLVIPTPFDKCGVSWSKVEPSFVVLNRIVKLAEAALLTIETSLFINDLESSQKILRPPLKGYDILIWTKPSVNTLRWLAVDVDTNTLEPVKQTPDFKKLPILNFHPIRLYIDELRKHYSEFCLFFYDFYGGSVIGAVLKPAVHQLKELKISNMKCCVAKNNKLSVDIDVMINDFYILGRDVVSYIEKCTAN